MGLKALDPDALVEIDERYPEEMAERRTLLATRHGEVFAIEPGTAAARAEVLDVLAALLPRRYPLWFARDHSVLHNHLTGEDWDLGALPLDPLEVAGRLVMEDLCLIDTASGGGPALRAALLCAPSGWRLSEKIGRPLTAVHGPVPLYAERLSDAVDRFMRTLRPGKVAERLNWGLSGERALFQPERREFSGEPGRVFLRTERQTLMRLPSSGMVLFAIRVHSTALERIVAMPGAARSLHAALQALSGSMLDYKGLRPTRDTLLAYLRETSEVS